MTGPAEGAARRPPDLLFCRGCGGSVARRDFLAGRALLLEGRAWCPACAPAMLGRRRVLRAVLWTAALVGTGVLAAGQRALLVEGREAAARTLLVEGEAAAARAAAEDARRRLAGLEDATRGLAALVEAEGRALEALRRDAPGREAVDDRLEGVERSLGVVLDGVEGMRREITALRGPPGLTEAEEADLLERMEDANAGVRFEALWRLRRGAGEAARKAAVRGLADPEDSVRYQAALLARELAVKEAVPALVERLADASVAVRVAAVDALRALEGTDLGFDALEPAEGKREEAVRLWRKRIEGR